MNLRNIANRYIQRVNPDQIIKWERSSGYIISDDGRPVPQYVEIECPANVQSVGDDTLRQINGLNIEGALRSVYLSENAKGVSYRAIQGGDIIKLSGYEGESQTSWKVIRIQEAWHNWAHVLVVQQ